MAQVVFKNSEVNRKVIDGFVVNFTYEYLELLSGLDKDIKITNKIKVLISRWIMEYWGFTYLQLDDLELIKIAFPFAVNEAKKKVREKNNENKLIDINISISTIGYTEYPYSLDKIEDIEGYTICQ